MFCFLWYLQNFEQGLSREYNLNKILTIQSLIGKRGLSRQDLISKTIQWHRGLVVSGAWENRKHFLEGELQSRMGKGVVDSGAFQAQRAALGKGTEHSRASHTGAQYSCKKGMGKGTKTKL